MPLFAYGSQTGVYGAPEGTRAVDLNYEQWLEVTNYKKHIRIPKGQGRHDVIRLFKSVVKDTDASALAPYLGFLDLFQPPREIEVASNKSYVDFYNDGRYWRALGQLIYDTADSPHVIPFKQITTGTIAAGAFIYQSGILKYAPNVVYHAWQMVLEPLMRVGLKITNRVGGKFLDKAIQRGYRSSNRSMRSLAMTIDSFTYHANKILPHAVMLNVLNRMTDFYKGLNRNVQKRVVELVQDNLDALRELFDTDRGVDEEYSQEELANGGYVMPYIRKWVPYIRRRRNYGYRSRRRNYGGYYRPRRRTYRRW